jgi:uncharacterized cupredoxin-like copper-binding protein
MKALLKLGVLLAVLVPGDIVLAKGDLATRATRLEPLVLGNDQSDFHMSVKEYKLETGKYYRWKIEASGKREYNLKAHEFWRNAWIRQVAVGKMEIKTSTLEELDFDDAGSLEVYFIPIRPGTYEFRLDGLEERGMKGKLVVE